MELVRGRLQIESKPWLMIVDNADNMDTFFSSGSRPIASYFPKSALGKILITSRSLDVAERLTGTEKAIKRLGVMDGNEALEFLRKKATREIGDADGRSLIKILESVPLAMNQAVAYINRRRIPVSRYLEIFQRSNRDKSTLLNFDSGDIRRNENVSNSIITTWQVTLNQIQEEHPDAANLLSLMSFFHNTNIPKVFLRGHSVDPDDGTLDDNLDVLSAYSLVITEFDSDVCDMHSLVQFCAQKWLAASNNLAHSKHTFLEQVCGHLPKREDAKFWKLASATMFHIDSALDNDRITDDDVYSYEYTVASIYLVKSIEHSDLRAPAFADRMARAALRNNQPSTALIFMHGCANAYLIHGDVEKAALVYERIDELDIKDGDASTPPPARVEIDQLRFYRQQGKLEEANMLASKLINRIEDQIAQHDPHTPLYERLAGFDNLINIYDYQLQPVEAEATAERFIDACQGNMDKHDVLSLILVKNLATRYASLDQFGLAAGISKASVEISTKLLGPMHIETLGARYNEAFALAALFNYKEAEEMAEEVYNAQREVIGPTSQHTVLTLGLLARLKYRNGHRAEAIALLEKGLREAEDLNKGPMRLQEACESLLATMLATMKKSEGYGGKAMSAEGGSVE
ncbi:hypothetical protein VHEMI06096 [[Torrubiella] hemipterigena]|nr:hypothetical protein VHEMI06096 [[Torrubiella] hemipterigena]